MLDGNFLSFPTFVFHFLLFVIAVVFCVVGVIVVAAAVVVVVVIVVVVVALHLPQDGGWTLLVDRGRQEGVRRQVQTLEV